MCPFLFWNALRWLGNDEERDCLLGEEDKQARKSEKIWP